MRNFFWVLLLLSTNYLLAQPLVSTDVPRPSPSPAIGTWGPSTSIIANPNAYIAGSGGVNFERYLARAINMEDFSETLGNNPKPWDGESWDNFYKTSFFNNSPCSCGEKVCRCKYSIEQYESGIKMLTDLKAAYILNVMGYYQFKGESVFMDSENYTASNYNLASLDVLHNSYYLYRFRRVIEDINKAYDQNGLRRPIIDGFIPEGLNKDLISWGGAGGVYPFDGKCHHHVEFVKIPPSVISAFTDQMTPDVKAYYYKSDNTPKDGLYFDFNRIVFISIWGNNVETRPDLNKLEGRMWLYFVCKQLIDLGYTSINLSQTNMWMDTRNCNIDYTDTGLTQADKENKTLADGSSKYYPFEVKKSYWELTRLLKKVREYAVSNHKLIVLWNQSDRVYYEYEETSNGTYAKKLVNGIPIYLFDWNNVAMRPIEVLNNQTPHGRNIQPCSSPAMMKTQFVTAMPSCINNPLIATIDPCSGTNYERSAPGYSPRPWATDPNNINALPNTTTLPYGQLFSKQASFIHWDGGSGRFVEEAGYADNPKKYSGQTLINHKATPVTGYTNGNTTDNFGTYGYDDARWWSAFVEYGNGTVAGDNRACAKDWLKYHYAKVRGFDQSDHTYFLPIPGRMLKRHKMVHDELVEPENTTHYTFDLYDPANTPIKDYVQNDIWNVKYPTMVFSKNETGGTSDGSYVKKCSTTSFEEGEKMRGSYTFSVSPGTSDLSSIYTWHIQWSDGTWEPFTYGISRVFNPTRMGTFTIYLVQDNLGLPASMYGVRTFSATHTVSVTNLITKPCGPAGAAVRLAPKPIIEEIVPTKELSTTERLQIFGGQYVTSASTTTNTTLVQTVQNETFNLRYYPQPTSNNLTIELNLATDGKLSLELLDVTGKSVIKSLEYLETKGNATHSLDMSTLPSGIYLLKASFNNRTETVKVIKI